MPHLPVTDAEPMIAAVSVGVSPLRGAGLLRCASSRCRRRGQHPHRAARADQRHVIGLPSGTWVWIVAGHTDMRKGFDGLAALVQTALAENPFRGL
jgi:hypothetical protein